MLQRDTFFNRSPQKAPDVPAKPDTAAAIIAAATRSSLAPGAPPVVDAGKPAKAPVTGSQMIVGPNIKLKGVEISDCDMLMVEGHVEATVESRMLQIAQMGTFTGTAIIDVAEIHGRFAGELTVRKCLTIHATGHVSGTIRYGKVVIEEGGELSGDIKKLAEDDKASRIPHLPTAARLTATPVLATHS